MTTASLVKKLRIPSGQRILILRAPQGYLETLGELPDQTIIESSPQGKYAFVQLFLHSIEEMKAYSPAAFAAVETDGLLWLCYPKGGIKAGTDLNRDILWELVVNRSDLRPVAQVAIDAIWSAVRLRPGELVGK